MTDEQILNALKSCGDRIAICDDCPYEGRNHCSLLAKQDIIERFNTLKAENDALRERLEKAVELPCTAERKFEHIADALIAAGIGDVKRHRVFVSKDGKEVKQLYSGEEVENIVKERNELKVELRDKVDYIHEQDEVIKEYKHRAEVAERALRSSISFLTCRACQAFLYGPCDTDACGDERCINNFLKQAEKEIAEEGKE